MRRLATLLVVSVVWTSACSYAEMLDFVEGGSGTTDLTSPEQPVDVRAAGSTEEAKTNEEKAEKKIKQSLESEEGVGVKIGIADEAVALRPRDARFLIYRGWYQLIAGDTGAAITDFAMADGLALEQFPGEEGQRRADEFFLDATAAILTSYPDGSNTRARMRFVYCRALSRYRTTYGTSLLGSAYLDFTAHTELCN